ncbi:MAG: hypothetical protein P4L84_30145 [Isosphaeraceae bacterium]|nr:hypothetical protein [Isosphaeraceae bacterium]
MVTKDNRHWSLCPRFSSQRNVPSRCDITVPGDQALDALEDVWGGAEAVVFAVIPILTQKR